MKTLDDGIIIDESSMVEVNTAKDGTLLCSAQVRGSGNIVHYLQSPDGKTTTLDTDGSFAKAASLFGMDENSFRSDLWP